MKKLLPLLLFSALSGCAVIQSTGLNESDPTVTTQRENIKKEFDTIQPPAAGRPISVAVYSFQDKTGQRRPQANIASLSTAVTQGSEVFLIQALQNVGRGQWFDVVERVGIDNLTKERLIIRQMREAYEGPNAKPLLPMQFAGIILEGGIIGYDQSTTSGGAGARILGIGKQTQWSTDTVTISLRAVSVQTGKVLASTTVQKTILSSADSVTALKFYDAGTKSFEAEAGLTINEPGTYAVKATVEMAVVELIKEGVRKGIWDYRPQPQSNLVVPPASEKIPVISSEIKHLEVKKDELGQTKTETAPASNLEATPQQPVNKEDTNRNTEESASKTVTGKTVTAMGKSNVRETNQSGSPIIAVLESKKVVKVLKEEEKLYLVELPNGKRGWIAKDTVKTN